MRKINKQLNLLITEKENFYKIVQSTKLNMNLYVIILLDILMKTETNLFYKCEHKNKIKIF